MTKEFFVAHRIVKHVSDINRWARIGLAYGFLFVVLAVVYDHLLFNIFAAFTFAIFITICYYTDSVRKMANKAWKESRGLDDTKFQSYLHHIDEGET